MREVRRVIVNITQYGCTTARRAALQSGPRLIGDGHGAYSHFRAQTAHQWPRWGSPWHGDRVNAVGPRVAVLSEGAAENIGDLPRFGILRTHRDHRRSRGGAVPPADMTGGS